MKSDCSDFNTIHGRRHDMKPSGKTKLRFFHENSETTHPNSFAVVTATQCPFAPICWSPCYCI